MEKLSQLVEVVGPRNINILVDFHLCAFRDRRNTKDDDRNVLTEGGFLAYSMGGCKEEFGPKA